MCCSATASEHTVGPAAETVTSCCCQKVLAAAYYQAAFVPWQSAPCYSRLRHALVQPLQYCRTVDRSCQDCILTLVLLQWPERCCHATNVIKMLALLCEGLADQTTVLSSEHQRSCQSSLLSSTCTAALYLCASSPHATAAIC